MKKGVAYLAGHIKTTNYSTYLSTQKGDTIMSCYYYEIEDGPTCSIVPAGNGRWAIYMNDYHIINSGSPQNCVTMIYEMNADMGDYDQWRKYIPHNIQGWTEQDCEG